MTKQQEIIKRYTIFLDKFVDLQKEFDNIECKLKTSLKLLNELVYDFNDVDKNIN